MDDTQGAFETTGFGPRLHFHTYLTSVSGWFDPSPSIVPWFYLKYVKRSQTSVGVAFYLVS